jgi:hypothetical protein
LLVAATCLLGAFVPFVEPPSPDDDVTDDAGVQLTRTQPAFASTFFFIF